MLKAGLAALPAIASIYLLFYLDANALLGRESALRDLFTLAVLVVGLVVSFLLMSRVLRKHK